jgi:hypothetical protein
MYYAGEVIKIRITKDNIDQFYIYDDRQDREDFILDRQALEKKMIDYENGKNALPNYPERYDLCILTYTQYKDPYLINDGCHRITAMRLMLKEGRIDGFDFYLIPTNILGAETKEDAFRLNEMVNEKLKQAGLPLWVKKFEFAEIDGKLVAWKNINIIDTGDINQPLQFGVDWKLNEGINFAEGKELKDLPRWKDLIK